MPVEPICRSAPPEFDPAYYQAANGDLRHFASEELRQHYFRHGLGEGRTGSPGALRENFLGLVEAERAVLEVGPFCSPVVTGDNVKYFDVLDSEALVKRANLIGLPVDEVPRVDYVSPTGDLGIVTEEFTGIVSSHAIEHQPDLVKHLQHVGRLLVGGGRYYLIVPDKRYCFDHFISTSSIADVLEAHQYGRTSHSVRSVIEHRALTTHNDSVRHWEDDHADAGHTESIAQRIVDALSEFEAADGAFIDVHAWQFVPESFRLVVNTLAELGLIDLAVERVYGTPRPRPEFTAVLKKL